MALLFYNDVAWKVLNVPLFPLKNSDVNFLCLYFWNKITERKQFMVLHKRISFYVSKTFWTLPFCTGLTFRSADCSCCGAKNLYVVLLPSTFWPVEGDSQKYHPSAVGSQHSCRLSHSLTPRWLNHTVLFATYIYILTYIYTSRVATCVYTKPHKLTSRSTPFTSNLLSFRIYIQFTFQPFY